jgi:DNA (cytosine-5)-methyltransferase 1
MAGFNVLYANEFVEEAQKTYKANHKAYLDTRDIRQVTPESILEITGLKKGEIDLFDGSPPCCAFSTAGKREKLWNEERAYSDGKVQKIEDLFYEYTRLLEGLQPKTFVAENVSGLVKGIAKGYFKQIMAELKKCGYKVKAASLNAKWLGVPQSRERIIFIGVRNDIVEKYNVHPIYPKPLNYIYSLKDALEGVQNDEQERQFLFECAEKYKWGSVLRKMPKNPRKPISGVSVTGGSFFNLKRESMYHPSLTICQQNGKLSISGNCHPLEDRKFTIAELKRITSIPDDFILTGNFEQQWERLARMVPPVMMYHIADTIRENILDKCKG